MSTSTDTAKQTKTTDTNQKDENIFNQWRARKDSAQNPASSGPSGILKVPDAAGSNRRRSRLQDLQFMKGNAAARRMTLIMRAKSDVSSEMVKPQVKKENTYKMKPDDGTQFSTSRVHQAVDKLLHDECDGMEYDRDHTSKLACELSEKIRDRVKDMGFLRYKIAANVFIGQIADQGIEVASRCCWDHTTDNYISVSYRNKSLLILALVFGVYFE